MSLGPLVPPWSPLVLWSLVLWSPGPLRAAAPSDFCFVVAAGGPGRGPQSAARKKLGAGLASEIYDEY